MTSRMTVFVLSWERPLYLWASLDSLYRNTKTPVNFVLLENGSADPLVAKVVDGFVRRGMFSEVVRSVHNQPTLLNQVFDRYAPDLGPYFGIVETDVIVEAGARCWVEVMSSIMATHPRLAMLGSKIDPTDFIDPATAAEVAGRPIDAALISLIKGRSSERGLSLQPGELADPFNPPGRLLMLRTEAMHKAGGLMRDGLLYRKLKEIGYQGAITGDVVHRHLSLLHLYDYPEYDSVDREDFMRRSGPLTSDVR